MKLDWKGAFLPAMRTAAALMVGNAGVTYLLGTANATVALTMFVIGGTLIIICSLTRS